MDKQQGGENTKKRNTLNHHDSHLVLAFASGTVTKGFWIRIHQRKTAYAAKFKAQNNRSGPNIKSHTHIHIR